ncbi:hypothetical protein D1872_89740 [compost metagenome]
MIINPIVWKATLGLLAAPGAGHLLIITSVAITSASINYFLKRRGHDLLAKLLNRLIWIGAGVVFMDAFFDSVEVVQALFGLKGL